MQTDNPFLDGMARLFTDAAGATQSLRNEIDTFVRQRMEKLVADMNLVSREEFEAVKAMAAKARTENESLATRVFRLWKKSPDASKTCEWDSGFKNRARGTLVRPQNLVPVWLSTASICVGPHA